ncbi:MAG: metallophosphoesterase [Flavobacteriaceae bacterium]|nr:metallophosphoesterase [Flavobacteriaceae bacterium]
MKQFIISLLVIFFTFQLQSCQTTANQSLKSHTVRSYGWQTHQISGHNHQDNSTLLRVAFLGDSEPKPCAEFPHTLAAVQHINTLNSNQKVDFVIGIGDVAHKGTEIQYEEATEVFQQLQVPYFPIMGNEEHGSTVNRYMEFAQQWNKNLKSPNHILNHEKLAFVLASPDYSRDFDNKSVRNLAREMQKLDSKPVILIVHSAQKGVYSERADKGIGNELFNTSIITQPNLAAVISGDLHMDLDRTHHSKEINGVHYMHIPALERTKIPDENQHSPMIRILTVDKSGNATMETFHTGNFTPISKHHYSFKLQPF